MAESAGLLFKIKGDASDAVRALNQTEAAGDKLTVSNVKLGASFSDLLIAESAGNIIGDVFVKGVTAAFNITVSLTKGIYDATVAASQFGSEIYNASVKTGLTTETISALKLASERTGVSMESLGTIVSRFSRLVGEAEQGSDKAAETLIRLGITPKEAIDDLDGALGKVFKRINDLPDPIAKATLAQQAFGKAGTELLKVIDDFNGDLPKAIEHARELGLVMSKEDAAAADEFGDTMDTLNRQIAAVGITIGKEFMPEFQRMADAVSDFVKNNKDDIARWAGNVRATLRGVIEYWNEAGKAAEDYGIKAAAARLAGLDPLARTAVTIVGKLQQKGRDAINNDPIKAGFENKLGDRTDIYRDFDAEKDSAKEADRRRKEAERKAALLAERDLTAQIRIENLNLKTVQDSMVKAYTGIRDALGGDDSIAEFTAQTNAATKDWAGNLQRSLTYLEELEKRALKADATANERALLQVAQDERRHTLKLAQDAEIKRNADAAWEVRMQRAEAEAAVRDEDFNRRMQQQEQLQQAAQAGFLSSIDLTTILPGLNPEQGTFTIFDEILLSWEEMFDQITGDAPNLQAVLLDLNNMAMSAFQGLAQAIGSVVQQWVLYGKTGPAVMRQMLAAVLASVAAEAAVKAIMATAEGFYFLATHQYDSAALAFTAAAFYGSVAAVAAVTGRLVAGNSFNQQSSQATGSGASSSGGRSGDQGAAYSSREDGVIEQGRNQPGGVGVVVTIKDDGSSWLTNLLNIEVRNNTKLRDLIKEVAES